MLKRHHCHYKIEEQENITLIEVANIKTGSFWFISDLNCLSTALLYGPQKL